MLRSKALSSSDSFWKSGNGSCFIEYRQEALCQPYAYILCTSLIYSKLRWDLKGTSKLWSRVSLPTDATCWDDSTAPLNKLQVALGNKRSTSLICLTAKQENVQAVNQALKASQQWSQPRIIIYFLNWCISLSQDVYLVGASGRGGSDMINNWYAVWKRWFGASLVHLSPAVVRTHLLWWQIWRSEQQRHIWLQI